MIYERRLKKRSIQSLYNIFSKLILSLSKDQNSHKYKLNEFIDKLNDAIDKSTSKLYKKEKNPQTIKSLEHLLEVKKKELINTKSQNKIYRQQFDIINSKANERFTNEKYINK